MLRRTLPPVNTGHRCRCGGTRGHHHPDCDRQAATNRAGLARARAMLERTAPADPARQRRSA